MPVIALIAEGEYDLPALKSFITIIAGHHVQIESRACHGDGAVDNLYSAFLQDIAAQFTISRAIVVRDLGTKSNVTAGQRKTFLRAKLPPGGFPFSVEFIVAEKELEAWFLADEMALSDLVGKPIPTYPDPQTIRDPKNTLKMILASAEPSIAYLPSTLVELTHRVRIDIIRSRCPDFDELCIAVLHS